MRKAALWMKLLQEFAGIELQSSWRSLQGLQVWEFRWNTISEDCMWRQHQNTCAVLSSSLFVPVVNLEKISGLPKSDGDGIKAPALLSDTAIPKQSSVNSKEVLGKPSLLASPKELLTSAKAGSTSVITADTLNRKLENASSLSEKELGVVKSLKKISRESCLSNCVIFWLETM